MFGKLLLFIKQTICLSRDSFYTHKSRARCLSSIQLGIPSEAKERRMIHHVCYISNDGEGSSLYVTYLFIFFHELV